MPLPPANPKRKANRMTLPQKKRLLRIVNMPKLRGKEEAHLREVDVILRGIILQQVETAPM